MAAIFWCLYSNNGSTGDSLNDYTLDSALEFKWIFGPTLKPWYSIEYLVPYWNLDTRLNIWSHLQTSILKWMICVDIWWYVCKCNAGPGEMLLLQPRLRSSVKHSCHLFIRFDFARQSTCWAVEKIPPWAIESGCPERHESDNSLILNLGLHVVTRSMLSPIMSDYNRINSL